MIGFGQMPMAGSVLVSGLGEDLELIQEPFIALRNVNEMDLEHIRDLYDAGSVTAMENTKFGLERWMVGIDGDFWESLLPEKYRECAQHNPMVKINRVSEGMQQRLPALEERFLAKAHRDDIRAGEEFRQRLRRMREHPDCCMFNDLMYWCLRREEHNPLELRD